MATFNFHNFFGARYQIVNFSCDNRTAWWMLHQWLQAYAYRTDISWWIFAAAGIGAIGITLMTVSYQSIKAALVNPVNSLRSE
jgi:putative ABC transport system permease protein